MNIFNQPPETDIPLAFAGLKSVDSAPAVLHADLSDTKEVKKKDEAAAEAVENVKPAAPRLTKEQLAFKYLDRPTPGQK